MDIYKVKDRRFPKEFRRVVEYIRKHKSVDVILGEQTDYVGPFDRRIIIHHNYDLRHNGLYVLLFECGKTYYGSDSEVIGDPTKSTQQLKNMVLHTRDKMAWDKGLDIATKLNLKNFNPFDYRDYQNRKLLKYFSKESLVV